MISSIQNSSSVPVTGAAGQPIKGQATEKPVSSVGAASNGLQNPSEWQGSGSVGHKKVSEAVSDANEMLATLKSDLMFSIDNDADRVVVKIVDRETQEVIRQIPTKEMLELAKSLKSFTSGLLLNEKL